MEARGQVDKLEVAARKQEIETRYGPWTAHNLQLQDDLYTIRPGVAGGNEARVRRVLQLVADLAHGPIERLRILDLGALEGLFAVELARQGASVVAVEGREANLEKMRLAKEALGLEHLELRHEDVRALDRARHGEFDVVLCLGLLYHLDAPDIFLLLERMREVCRDLVIIETRISPYPSAQHQHNGRRYWGVVTAEPPPDTPPHSRDALWSSIGNPRSFERHRRRVPVQRPGRCGLLLGTSVPPASSHGGASGSGNLRRLRPAACAHSFGSRVERACLGAVARAGHSASPGAAAPGGVPVAQGARPPAGKAACWMDQGAADPVA
jgi:2-polyprenyl-3-methyl-5-hydroxy-6-metoxy-1,4-benzoquinol methylase